VAPFRFGRTKSGIFGNQGYVRKSSVRESVTGQTLISEMHILAAGCGKMRNSFSIVERPMCPTCKHRMGLARISPGERGFERRTFECSTCRRIEEVSFATDPLKTNAVGWLAGELKPPT
jgi:hypothetical protein